MLIELHIEDLGVISSLDLVFGAGLTVFTGETGAGKTMLVEAIGLLVGGRADADDGARRRDRGTRRGPVRRRRRRDRAGPGGAGRRPLAGVRQRPAGHGGEPGRARRTTGRHPRPARSSEPARRRGAARPRSTATPAST